MSYRTCTGRELEYAHKHARPIMESLPDTAHYMMQLWHVMIDLDYKLSVAMQDNTRLKHENAFMVRVMSEKENKAGENMGGGE